MLGAKIRVLDEEHPETLKSINTVAVALLARGDYAEARRLLEQVVEASIHVLCEAHPNTLKFMNNLALALLAPGDHAEVRRVRERILKVSTQQNLHHRLEALRKRSPRPPCKRSQSIRACPVPYTACGQRLPPTGIRSSNDPPG